MIENALKDYWKLKAIDSLEGNGSYVELLTEAHSKILDTGSSDTSSSNRDSRITDDDRSNIYQFIQKNHGAHLRKIVKELGLAMRDTQYHLKKR